MTKVHVCNPQNNIELESPAHIHVNGVNLLSNRCHYDEFAVNFTVQDEKSVTVHSHTNRFHSMVEHVKIEPRLSCFFYHISTPVCGEWFKISPICTLLSEVSKKINHKFLKICRVQCLRGFVSLISIF